MTTSKLKIIDKGEIYFYEVSEPATTERFDEKLQKKVTIDYRKSFRIDPNQLSIFPDSTVASLNEILGTSYTLEEVQEMIQHAEAIKDEKEFGQEANINSGTEAKGQSLTTGGEGQDTESPAATGTR